MLPLGVSAVTVGFGFLIVLDTPPLDLRTSCRDHPDRPRADRDPVRRARDAPGAAVPSTRTCARPPRCSARRRDGCGWRSTSRIAARAALVAAGFAFAISLGEFGATLFIVRPETTTLPVAIYRLLGRPGATNFDQAMAASTILMVAHRGRRSLAIERLRVRDVGEF